VGRDDLVDAKGLHRGSIDLADGYLVVDLLERDLVEWVLRVPSTRALA
jgi:hypothetical protein